MYKTITFSDEQISELFGHEAAENEVPERLREYYFKSQTFDQVTADLPLRILVGHKGIGKSALFQIAIHEDREARNLPIEIRPDDVTGIAVDSTNLLEQIKLWKDGLRKIIHQKVIEEFSLTDEPELKKLSKNTGKLVSFIVETFKPLLATKVDLDPAKKAVFDVFCTQRKINVYMDDLDRGWKGRSQDISRISALLNAVRDLSRDNSGLNFRISLRSDVYFLVRTSDESTDKIGSSVIWYSWTNHQILALLVKRVESFFGRVAHENKLVALSQPELATYLNSVLADRFKGKGKWANVPMYRVLMSLIRRRPRDLVKLLTLAARRSKISGSAVIGTEHLEAIFEEYSHDRVQDTVNEYRSELPEIERLIFGMKPNRAERKTRSGYLYKTDGLLQKIKSISESGTFKDANGTVLSPRQVAAFMYKINLLIASKQGNDGFIDRHYFEENRYLSSSLADFGYDWEVHPAYRWALQPDAPDDIFQALSLSSDKI